MIKVVLFDVDGVLANGALFSQHLELEYGITQQMISPFFTGRFQQCLVGSADLKQELVQHIEQWGWQGSVDEFIDYWFRSEHYINEPLMQVVQQLRQRGLPCYLATDQEKYRTAYILDQMGFANSFDGMFSSAHIGYTKRDQRFFAHILQALHPVRATEILFWDDTPAKVEIARSVGIQAEVYQDFTSFMERMKQYL